MPKQQQYDWEVYEAMHSEKPISRYRKTILGKVFVTVLNVFSHEPAAVLLYGEPGNTDSIVNCYSIEEDVYFKRMNRRLFESGVIISVPMPTEEVPEKPAEPTLEQASDETLKSLVNTRGFKPLEAALNNTNSEALVNRILIIARQEEKSEKIIKAIETRLAEIQSARFKTEEK